MRSSLGLILFFVFIRYVYILLTPGFVFGPCCFQFKLWFSWVRVASWCRVGRCCLMYSLSGVGARDPYVELIGIPGGGFGPFCHSVLHEQLHRGQCEVQGIMVWPFGGALYPPTSVLRIYAHVYN